MINTWLMGTLIQPGVGCQGRAALALTLRNDLRIMQVKEEKRGEGLPGKRDRISKSTERTLRGLGA